MMLSTFLAASLVATGAPPGAAATPAPGVMCSTSPSVEFSVARTRRIVHGSQVVVRAVVTGSITGRTLKPWERDILAFEVREVLKGDHGALQACSDGRSAKDLCRRTRYRRSCRADQPQILRPATGCACRDAGVAGLNRKCRARLPTGG